GGTKAEALAEWAATTGRAYLRFDYFGHGASTGAFEEGTIGRWRDDVLAVIDDLTEGPLVLAGSSMGGWLACLAALARPERVEALVLIAPAADFTEKLMAPNLPPEAHE
ncbi:alpha/beta hydrolase, partial [Clostridioides difficile]|uniref:alpha/beta hydrolase n=1 Tax=Clostridioides difficile TaxID=1496 RepID=UPI0018DDC98A